MRTITIKEMRNRLNLTQQEVAELTGVPRRTIQNWENEVRQPTIYVERLFIDRLITLKKYIEMATALQIEMHGEDDAREIAVNGIIHNEYTDHETNYGYVVAYYDGEECGVAYYNDGKLNLITGDEAEEFCEEQHVW